MRIILCASLSMGGWSEALSSKSEHIAKNFSVEQRPGTDSYSYMLSMITHERRERSETALVFLYLQRNSFLYEKARDDIIHFGIRIQG